MTFCTIQFLRFIAAFLVLLFHLGLMNSGNKGVDIFFVISGFVMYLKLFASKRPGPFYFFVSRLTKIFFLYWITLLLLYIVRPFTLDSSVLSTILLLPEHHPIFNVSWTLSYELYFYFLIGAAAYLLPGKYFNTVFLFVLMASTIFTVITLSVPYHIKGISFLLGRDPWEFLLGISSAFLSAFFLKSAKPGVLLLLAFSSLLLLIIINNLSSEIPLLRPATYGILSMFLIGFITAYEKKVIIPEKIATPFKILGDASYAIYLLGPLVAMLIPGNNAFSKTTIIIVTILVSVFFNRVVEMNGLPWCRKMIYRLKPVPSK